MWKRLWRFVPKTSGPRSLVRAKEVRRNDSTLNGVEKEPILPTYVARSRENLAERKARLLYQSRYVYKQWHALKRKKNEFLSGKEECSRMGFF